MRASLREYAAVQRERYQHATRAEKHRLLDEPASLARDPCGETQRIRLLAASQRR